MNCFNLIDEPWIPVRLLDGGWTNLGVKDTLLRSREITAIENPSPLVVAALYRFLLAVLYRALEGPASLEQARTIFLDGLPVAKIANYLEKWRGRFWLFHDRWPFGQIPDFEPKEWRTWTAMAAESNADNAKVLFDHVNVQNPGEISPSAAARLLLAAQTFSVSCGKSELSHTKTAPSATGVMVLPLGRNLHDTLVFALVPQNGHVFAEDLPIWERDPDSLSTLRSNPSRPINGVADRYTWRTRAIRLKPEPTGNVIHVAFASGMHFQEGEGEDPMLGYRIDREHGRLPIQFGERGLWRDFDSLLPGPQDDGNPPRVLHHAMDLASKSVGRLPRVTLVLGQANNKANQAKIEFWRMERFTLPEALAGDVDIPKELRKLLNQGEEVQSSLWSACSRYARNLIGHGDREPDRKDVRAFLDQMIPIPLYWSTLETRFHELLQAYTLDKTESEIERFWLGSVRDALRYAWEQHKSSVANGDAWTIRALMKAELPVRKELNSLDKKISNLPPLSQKEDA